MQYMPSPVDLGVGAGNARTKDWIFTTTVPLKGGSYFLIFMNNLAFFCAQLYDLYVPSAKRNCLVYTSENNARLHRPVNQARLTAAVCENEPALLLPTNYSVFSGKEFNSGTER